MINQNQRHKKTSGSSPFVSQIDFSPCPVLMMMAIILGYVDDDGHVSSWKRKVFSVPLQPKNHNVSLILDDHIMMNIDQSII